MRALGSCASGALAGLLVLFALSLIIQMIGCARRWSRPPECSSQLRRIGQGLLLDATDHNSYPRTRYDDTKPPTAFTPAAAGGAAISETDPFFGPNRPADNDVTAALFLLIRQTDLPPEVFVCPGTNHAPDTFGRSGARFRVNFTSERNLSYSYANPYPSAAAVALGYRLDHNAIASFAIAADRNDGDLDGNLSATSASPMAVQCAMNSRNHGGEGQNVLYNDGHVSWEPTSWAGDQNDCIWGDAVVNASTTQPAQLAPARTGNGVDPKLPLDSILLPKKGLGLP